MICTEQTGLAFGATPSLWGVRTGSPRSRAPEHPDGLQPSIPMDHMVVVQVLDRRHQHKEKLLSHLFSETSLWQ